MIRITKGESKMASSVRNQAKVFNVIKQLKWTLAGYVARGDDNI